MTDVTDKMVEAAWAAWNGPQHVSGLDSMHAAIEAALSAREPDKADMIGLCASNAACYLWPDDTSEHKGLRSAYIQGAHEAALAARDPVNVGGLVDELRQQAEDSDAFCRHSHLHRKSADVIEELVEALNEIERWTNAYPISAFPEPDMRRAAELLREGGMTLDAISASNMRHVLDGVSGIVRPAIERMGVKLT